MVSTPGHKAAFTVCLVCLPNTSVMSSVAFALRGCAKKKIQKNPRLLWKWVVGPVLNRNFFFLNHPKIPLNQYRYFGVVYHKYSVCIHS